MGKQRLLACVKGLNEVKSIQRHEAEDVTESNAVEDKLFICSWRGEEWSYGWTDLMPGFYWTWKHMKMMEEVNRLFTHKHSPLDVVFVCTV